LSDFDKTLTVTVVDGQQSLSVIAQLRNNKILTQSDYPKRAHALFEKYHTFETDPALSFVERSAQMQKWWDEHHALLIECGIDRQSIAEVVSKRSSQFRVGALKFIDTLQENNIPLVIMSAAPADMIASYLAQEGRLYDNIKIVANWYIFDNDGKMIGVKEPIIHSLNKYETTLHQLPFFPEIEPRTDVILIGDSLDDIGMVQGFNYTNLIKIGFYNKPTDEHLALYQENFDVVITGDDGMEYVNDILEKIIR